MSVVYKTLSEIEHVKERKEMYLGESNCIIDKVFTFDIESNEFKQEKIKYCPGLIKLFDEVFTNALDNIHRSKNQTFINVNIDTEHKIVSVENNGYMIPLNKFEDTDKYTPEVLFSQMRTSSNYNENRSGAGINGLGVKLVTILSKTLHLRIVNNKLEYDQCFNDGCQEIEEPTLKKIKESDICMVEFEPNLEILDNSIKPNEWNEIFENTSKILYRRAYEGLSVVNNGKITMKINNINIKNLDSHNLGLKYYNTFKKSDKEPKFYETKDYSLFIGLSNKFNQFSYVNGINTYEGGSHVNNILKQLTKGIITLAKSDKENEVKNNLFLLLSIKIQNPVFSSQSKEKLTSRNGLTKILKLSDERIKEIYNHFDFKAILDNKDTKNANKKVSKKDIYSIEKLIDAENAGKRNCKCTLFICEGDSASSLAKIGMTCKSIGHANYGCYPLTGKILNTENATDKKAYDNKVLSNLTKIIGLKYKEQIPIEKLRYQHIVMLKDADVDGANIMGLVYNFFNTHFKYLLEIEGFFKEFITPMIKVSIPTKIKVPFEGAGTIVKHGNMTIYPFMNENEYNEFMKLSVVKNNVKNVEYIKGLATNEQYEIKEYFREYLKNCIGITYDSEANNNLMKTFGKGHGKEDQRKNWISTLTDETYLPRKPGENITISEFLNTDHLSYMYEANYRAIPSIIDGLKPSQRKVLYGLFKMKNAGTKFSKVFQLCGQIANNSNYHHGDSSLNEVIFKMAQDYPGANNICLLNSSGFFGSRRQLGKDHGAARYVSARLSDVSRLIYPEEDDKLLRLRIEDNETVEPIYYVPIIPLILVNGANGIGNGWKTTIPEFDIRNIVDKIKNYGKEAKLNPKIENWKGKYEIENSKIIYSGIFENKGTELVITELPHTLAIDKFEDLLKDFIVKDKFIESFVNKNTSDINSVHYEIKLKEPLSNEQIIKEFKLSDSVSMTSMVGFNKDYSIRKYNSIEDIFNEWYEVRKDLYIKRKEMHELELEQIMKILDNKARFIKMIVENELKIMKRKKVDIEKDLEKHSFYKVNDSFDYLLSLPVSTLTIEKYNELMKKLDIARIELNEYREKTIYDIWNEELDNLVEELGI